MDQSLYPIRRNGKKMEFRFWSTNSRGENAVLKVVTYERVVKYGRVYYNLAFGDFDEQSRIAHDDVVTNNGDMRKILRTVISTIDQFFLERPKDRVHIDGSDAVRRSYYHKIVRDYFDVIFEHYKVRGCVDRRIELFRANIEYEYLIISIN